MNIRTRNKEGVCLFCNYRSNMSQRFLNRAKCHKTLLTMPVCDAFLIKVYAEDGGIST